MPSGCRTLLSSAQAQTAAQNLHRGAIIYTLDLRDLTRRKQRLLMKLLIVKNRTRKKPGGGMVATEEPSEPVQKAFGISAALQGSKR